MVNLLKKRKKTVTTKKMNRFDRPNGDRIGKYPSNNARMARTVSYCITTFLENLFCSRKPAKVLHRPAWREKALASRAASS
ncbi:MAG: hypothetical protein ACOY32_06050 [Thermodesulfobacteriota bacterium]